MRDHCKSRCGEAGGAEGVRTVRLRFLRAELLYDIRNCAYIEGEVSGEEDRHSRHVIVDIGEAGNVDRVTRLLGAVHASVTELLYPWTRSADLKDGEEADDRLAERAEYVVELRVPESVSRTTVHLLEHLIHEYMVCRVMADWLSVTCPESAAGWAAKADAAEAEITRAKSVHRGVFTRRGHPW